MKQFVKLPKELSTIISKDRYLALAVYFTIRSHQNQYTNKARFSTKNIAEQLGICERDVVKAIKILEENNHIKVEKLKSQNNAFEFSEYSFTDKPEDNFEMIDIRFLYEKIPARYKGLLIFLKLNCEVDGIWFRYKSLTELAKIIGVTRKTASKYLKDLDKYIEPSKVEGLHFISELFTLKELTLKPIIL